jgi:hypothetical protein
MRFVSVAVSSLWLNKLNCLPQAWRYGTFCSSAVIRIAWLLHTCEGEGNLPDDTSTRLFDIHTRSRSQNDSSKLFGASG